MNQPLQRASDPPLPPHEAISRSQKDSEARLARLLPTAFVLPAALMLLNAASGLRWATVLQIASVLALISICALRRRISIDTSVAVTLGALYCLGVSTAETLEFPLSIAVHIALAFAVVQIAWREKPPWLAGSMYAGSCVCAAVLLYLCARSTPASQSLVAWILLAVCSACLALIRRVETQ